jgi:hypothetical protein
MKEQDSHNLLAAGLRTVAEDDEQLGASNAVGLRLLAEVQAIADARRRRTMVLSLAAAAVLATALAVPAWRSLHSRQDVPAPTAEPTVARELVTEFFPLAYSNVPARGGYVVRMQVPRSALESFGAAGFVSDNRSANVLADVVVGDDGLARAVRFVRVVDDMRPVSPGPERQEQAP